MARRPPIGKCVHCLKEDQPRTWDHVFPESWYPDTTPRGVEKWKIPVCTPCNADYGKVEQDLLLRIGLCVDPHAVEAAGIPPKVLRSLNPAFAKDEKDRKARQRKREEMIAGFLAGNEVAAGAIYPGFGEKWGRSTEEQTAVRIPKSSVDRLTEKIIRGIGYIEDDRFIDFPYRVTIYPPAPVEVPQVSGLLEKFGAVHACGPGIVVRRAVVPEDGLSALYEVTIWGMFRSYGAVLNGEQT